MLQRVACGTADSTAVETEEDKGGNEEGMKQSCGKHVVVKMFKVLTCSCGTCGAFTGAADLQRNLKQLNKRKASALFSASFGKQFQQLSIPILTPQAAEAYQNL